MKKMKRALALLILALSLAVPTATPVIGILDTAEPVSAAVRIDRSVVTIFKGQTKKLTLTGPAKRVKRAKWSSSNKSVVTVNKKGKITGRKEGAVTITAKVSRKKYTCKVTVKAYGGVTKKCFRMDVGKSRSLDRRANWKSSDDKIAKVSKYGLIQAVNPGTCEISAIVRYRLYIYIIKVPNPVTVNTTTPAPGPTTVTTIPVPDTTVTPAPVPVITATPKPIPIITDTPNPTATATPTPTPAITATPKPTPVVTSTPKPVVTATPTPAPTITATPTLTPQSLVWLSATGEKYHKIPNCGKMDPSKARLVPLSEALQRGYPPCDKCF